MISAAKAHGRTDPDERQRIDEQSATLGLDKDIRIFVHDELAGPLALEAIVSPAVCQETVAELCRIPYGHLSNGIGRAGLPRAAGGKAESCPGSGRSPECECRGSQGTYLITCPIFLSLYRLQAAETDVFNCSFSIFRYQ